VFHEFADTEEFAREAELFLCGFEGRDARLWVVGAVEIPGEEAGEVLEGAEDFVAADWGGVSLGEDGM
jgi:hypothetical protein